MVTTLAAFSPILLCFTGIVILKKPVLWVAPVGFLYTLLIGAVFFEAEYTLLPEIFSAAMKISLQSYWAVGAAFVLLTVMREAGAMEVIGTSISALTGDQRIQMILIAFGLGTFIEGAAGGGCPAAVCAPLLVGLGYDPVFSAAALLIANGISASFGAVGASTMTGFASVADTLSIREITAVTGWYHAAGCVVICPVMLLAFYGRRGLRGLFPLLPCVSAAAGLSMWLTTAFWGPEFCDMTTGIVIVAAALACIRWFPREVPEDFLWHRRGAAIPVGDMSARRAFMPYILILVVLPAVKLLVPARILKSMGTQTWIGCVFMVISFISSVSFGTAKSFGGTVFRGMTARWPALISISCLVAMTSCMEKFGMFLLIADAATGLGRAYGVVALYIGLIGAYMSGSVLSNNVLFGQMHLAAAQASGISATLVEATSSAGGSLGNLICTNDIVSACLSLGISGKEGDVTRAVLRSLGYFLVIYTALAIILHYSGIVSYP